MFGFPRLSPPVDDRPAGNPGENRIYVSKEDIYGKGRSVLLARKGLEVSESTLPKFLRNGARHNQFEVKKTADADICQSNPITAIPRKFLRGESRVLVLDPHQKSMKRTIDCLFRCGFGLANIHPVRVPQHLDWALAKYRPDVLVLAHDLGGLSGSGLQLVQTLQLPASVGTILLTMEETRFSEAEKRWINRVCAEYNVRILFKPLNRHAMDAVLE